MDSPPARTMVPVTDASSKEDPATADVPRESGERPPLSVGKEDTKDTKEDTKKATEEDTKEDTKKATEEMTEEELIAHARRIKETVAELQEQVCRVQVTRGTAIDDLDSDHFKCITEEARQRRYVLVENARRGAYEYETTGVLSPETASSVVEETLVALCNDLLPSKASAPFFMVHIPAFVLDMNADARRWHEVAPGLVVYRFWQLLVRTPKGRALLLDDVDTESFEAVKRAICVPMYEGRLRERCIELLRSMPTKGRDRLTDTEKETLMDVFTREDFPATS